MTGVLVVAGMLTVAMLTVAMLIVGFVLVVAVAVVRRGCGMAQRLVMGMVGHSFLSPGVFAPTPSPNPALTLPIPPTCRFDVSIWSRVARLRGGELIDERSARKRAQSSPAQRTT